MCIYYERALVAKVSDRVSRVSCESISLSDCTGRILAEDVKASFSVPAFDRSPYDGYAFRSCDSKESGVTLKVIGCLRAGDVSSLSVGPGEAFKIMTGAMIPDGADAVVKYEDTDFTESDVTIHKAFRSGENVIRAGEDLRAGDVIANTGEVIDAGMAGLLASQNIGRVSVFVKPVIGIISTGSELQDIGTELQPGKIYNTSRYTFGAALSLDGFVPVFDGIAGDSEDEIADMIKKALAASDALIVTGGVSAGDYDRTPVALEMLGADIIVRDVDMKPGGKCVYAMIDNKLVCCLSGNPASALVNYYAIARPALRKLSGLRDYMPQEIDVVLGNEFKKSSPKMRIIRGVLSIADGQAVMHVPQEQGNGALKTLSGSNVMAIVPAGSGKLDKGTRLRGFML